MQNLQPRTKPCSLSITQSVALPKDPLNTRSKEPMGRGKGMNPAKEKELRVLSHCSWAEQQEHHEFLYLKHQVNTNIPELSLCLTCGLDLPSWDKCLSRISQAKARFGCTEKQSLAHLPVEKNFPGSLKSLHLQSATVWGRMRSHR